MADEEAPGAESETEQELRLRRKFTPEEALARLAGPGAMKGASAVSIVQQAENAVSSCLATRLPDLPGALRNVLHRHLKGSEALTSNLEQPLVGLAAYCQQALGSEPLLKEIVREADVEWGRLMDERPYFETAGAAPHADDPYTAASVRDALTELLASLEAAG